MKHKGQITVEFMMMLSLAILALFSVAETAFSMSSSSSERIAFSTAREEAYLISSRINELCIAGENFAIVYDFTGKQPAQANGKFIEVNYNNDFFDAPLACAAEGNLEPGMKVEMRNENGKVRIREA